MSNIAYFHGVVDLEGKARAFPKVLASLVNNRRGGLRIHKLKGYNIWSAYCNDYDRLLYTYVKRNNKNYICILDVVLNHDYDKSAFIRTPDMLNQFLELNGQAITHKINANDFLEHELEPQVNRALAQNDDDDDDDDDNDNNVDMIRFDFYNQQFVELDALQIDIVEKKQLPLIISGAPGSGKSLLSQLLLEQYVENNVNKEDPWPILYIAESEDLVQSMADGWACLPISKQVPANAVQFKTYKQLLIDLNPQFINQLNPNKLNVEFVDKIHCQNWLKDYLSKHNTTARTKGLSSIDLADLEAAYQELRIISGTKSLEEYIKLGSKNVLFQEQAMQRFLFDAYTAYLANLQANNSINPAFYTLQQQRIYKRIIVDEFQDLSQKQLVILFNLSINGEICYCGDDRQGLADSKSKIQFLSQTLRDNGFTDCVINLPKSHRCPIAVINMANVLSGLKSKITGNGQPDIVAANPEARRGAVRWVESIPDELLADLCDKAKNPDFAIVTNADNIERLKKLYGTTEVYTPKEIKGLEYKYVLVDSIFDDEGFVNANSILKAQGDDVSNKNNSNRAKKDHGHEELGTCFNHAFTAFTRSMDILYVHQPNRHNLDYILSCLKREATLNSPTRGMNRSQKNTTIDTDKWLAQVRVHLMRNDISRAKEIYVNVLHKSEDEFEVYRNLIKPQAQYEAAVTNNNSSSNCNSSPSASNNCTTSSNSSNDQIVANRKNSSKKEMKLAKLMSDLESIALEPTDSALSNLFTRENLNDCLFNMYLENGLCLFDTLVVTNKLTPFLFNHLIKAVKRIPSLNSERLNAICSYSFYVGINSTSFFRMCLEDSGVKFLMELFTINQKVSISQSTLLNYCKKESDSISLSAFELLCLNEKHHLFIKMILNRNQSIEITNSDLCLPIREKGKNRYVAPTPLVLLASSYTGREVLKTILIKNPGLIIEDENLNRTSKNDSNIDVFQNPRAALSSDKLGREILDLIARNRSRAERSESTSTNIQGSKYSVANEPISNDKFEQPKVEAAPSKVITFLNDFLTKVCDENLEILFKHNKVDDFLFKHPVNGRSCLFVCLFQKQSWRTLLIPFLIKHSDKLKSIQVNHLQERIDNSSEPKEQSLTILQSLMFEHQGVNALFSIIDKNKNLVLGTEDLCSIIPSQQTDLRYSLVSFLAQISTGRILFSLLLGRNADLKIPYHELIRPLITHPAHNPDNIFNNDTLLSALSSCSLGIQLLNRIIQKDTNIFISYEDLCTPQTHNNSGYVNITLLYRLTRNVVGHEPLYIILNRNPNIKLDTSDLCTHYLLDLEDVTPLYFLAKEPSGLGVLKNILTKNPNLIITNNQLREQIKIKNKDESIMISSAHSKLMETEEGQAILKIMEEREAGQDLTVPAQSALVVNSLFSEKKAQIAIVSTTDNSIDVQLV